LVFLIIPLMGLISKYSVNASLALTVIVLFSLFDASKSFFLSSSSMRKLIVVYVPLICRIYADFSCFYSFYAVKLPCFCRFIGVFMPF